MIDIGYQISYHNGGFLNVSIPIYVSIPAYGQAADSKVGNKDEIPNTMPES